MKLFLVVNVDWFFLSHRKEIALAAKEAGYEVTVVTKDTGKRREVEALGIRMIDFPMRATGKDIREEWRTLYFLYTLYRKERPDIVHHVGIKSILWGSLAAKWVGINGVVNAVSGLGVLFSQENPSRFGKSILKILRYAHKGRRCIVIFQNREDKELFLSHRIIDETDTVFIKGSGVDLNDYIYVPEKENGKIRIFFSGRMVKEKGVFVLIEAAERLRGKYEDQVVFLLCGGLWDSPGAITEDELHQRCDGVYIQWLDYRTDVKKLLQDAHIVAFPSYYREGVPKSLIEATACGRPIVTTDSIGCRDTVEENYNGFLVPIKDSEALAERLQLLIEDKVLRQQMGINSRALAERDFSLKKVVEKHLDVYKRLC